MLLTLCGLEKMQNILKLLHEIRVFKYIKDSQSIHWHYSNYDDDDDDDRWAVLSCCVATEKR